jgi:ATP-binding cassette, subfamily F, member 3
MAVVIATNLRKEIAGATLFEGVSFKLERRDRVALAGPNGAGKTTLLRCLTGETELHGGELVLEKSARVALHDQRPPRRRSLTLRDYVLSGASDLVSVEEELRLLEQAMAGGDHAHATLQRYARAQARLEHAGGWSWRERAAGFVRGLGFTEADLDRPLDTFSGGELTRASLARALAGDPDLLLLDEPTNHLDVTSLEWLERELASLDAAVLLVAHDRWFLEALTTAVLELEAGRSIFFPGPWHAWRRERAERALHARKTVDRVADDIARLERFVERFRYKKSKARQAQAKLTQIARLEKEKKVAAGEAALLGRRSRRLGFEFLKPARSGRTVIEVEGLAVEAGERALLAGVTFALERGEHVGLVGPNGSGKTTLVDTILGRRPATAGSARLGYGVELGYLAQHDALDSTAGDGAAGAAGSVGTLQGGASVVSFTQGATGLQRPQAQALLGQFLFSGWEAHEKPISALSGGERRRLELACVVASGSNFLVLDEPTNHLDLESREALEAALEAFPGTILLVSHDRALLDAVATRILAVEEGTVRSHDGGWADFVRAQGESQEPPAEAPVASAPDPGQSREQPKTERRQPRGPSELERLEAEISTREERIGELERTLAGDWSNVDLIAAHRRERDELQALLERWERLFEQAQA